MKLEKIDSKTSRTRKSKPLRIATLLGGWLLLFALTVECGHGGAYLRDADESPSSAQSKRAKLGALAHRLLLIGDAGDNHARAPLLTALIQRAKRAPEKTTIVFLGDNIYPDGLVPKTDPDHERAKGFLRLQVDAATASGAEVFFIPGNHDWARGRVEGLSNVRRAARFVERVGGPDARFFPTPGEPGPACVDRAEVRLVLLDTQWLLWYQDDRPRETQRALAQLTACIREAERHVVVMGHHPMYTLGPHGSFHTWRQHLFPLTDWQEWAYLPLPIIGSLYPLSRAYGVSLQDLPHPMNEGLMQRLRTATETHRPLLYAAGHEHSLQVFKSPRGPRYTLVSGSGSSTTAVSSDDRTLFAQSARGFMELDFYADGQAVLQVLVLDDENESAYHRAYHRRLTPTPKTPRP